MEGYLKYLTTKEINMNWKNRIYKSLTEAQFGSRPGGDKSGVKKGVTSVVRSKTSKRAKIAVKKTAGKRTKKEQEAYQAARKTYQKTGITPMGLRSRDTMGSRGRGAH